MIDYVFRDHSMPRSRLLVLPFTFLLALSCVAEEFQPPPSYRGIKLGMTKEQVRQKSDENRLPLKQFSPDYDSALNRMVPNPDRWEIGTVMMKEWATLAFKGGALAIISVEYKAVRKSRIDSILSTMKKYPVLQDEEIYDSAFGKSGSVRYGNENWEVDLSWRPYGFSMERTYGLSVQFSDLNAFE